MLNWVIYNYRKLQLKAILCPMIRPVPGMLSFTDWIVILKTNLQNYCDFESQKIISTVKIKTVAYQVLHILQFLFTVNAGLLNWFIYILHSDIWRRCFAHKYLIESCWNWKVPYADYIRITMYDDTLSLSSYAFMLILLHCMLILQHYTLKLKHYVVPDTRMPIHVLQHCMTIIHYLYWDLITICWYFSLYADRLTSTAETSSDTCHSNPLWCQFLYVKKRKYRFWISCSS